MKFAILLAATVVLASPLAYRDAVGQQVDSASRVDSASKDSAVVGTGSIVRFMVNGDRNPYSGKLSRLTPDSVILARCDHCYPLNYARNEISDLEVYRGSTYGRNLLFGFLGGAVGAGGIAALAVGSQKCSGDLCGLRMLAIPYAVFGGALVGTLIGIAHGKEIWDPVP